MSNGSVDSFKFRATDTVGSPEAEEDGAFLHDCFVESGYLERLRDCGDPARIVVGRTGSGKSALLQRLQQLESRAIVFKPEDLAFNYLARVNVFTFLEGVGVSTDSFLRLLWKHAVIVEVLKRHFDAESRGAWDKVWDFLRGRRDRNRSYAKAEEYLREWGVTFWEETEVRVKEAVDTVTKDLEASLGVSFGSAEAAIKAARNMKNEQKLEVKQRARSIIDKGQVRRLSALIDVLDDILEDRQKRYFILVDGLDGDWVASELQLRMIGALVEATREFRSVQNAKIVVALRADIMDALLREGRGAGFQREKIEGLCLNLRWSRDDLVCLVDRRINKLVRRRYEKNAEVRWGDVMPARIKYGASRSERQSAIDYVLARTFLRPRDAIVFVNEVIAASSGRARFTADIIRGAELRYSQGRLRSLEDEWSRLYPNLGRMLELLRAGPARYGFDDFVKRVEDALLSETEGCSVGEWQSIVDVYMSDCDARAAARKICAILNRVAVLGVRSSKLGGGAVMWSIKGEPHLDAVALDSDAKIYVHPALWLGLAVSGAHDVFVTG